MAKKLLFTVLSVILVYNTYKFTILFFQLSPEVFSSFAKFITAFALNLMITGSIAFLGFVYPTHRLLPKDYYHIKDAKKLTFWYKRLGVNYFKEILLRTFYRKKENKKYFNGTKSGIKEFDYNTKQSEFGHLIAFLLVSIYSLILLFAGHTDIFIYIQPMNILFNFYPIILQRKHRIITQRLISRQKSNLYKPNTNQKRLLENQ